MSTTFGALKTAVAEIDVRDPSAKTFSPTDIEDMIYAALAEVGRIAPEQFQEDITPIADTLDYTLRSSEFSDPVPEIEVTRVELWDGTTTPVKFLRALRPGSTSRLNQSNNGWRVWAGVLTLSNLQELIIDPDTHSIRVWGYSPYVLPDSDDDVISVSVEVERAVRLYTRIEALRRLNASRDLFTQWQTKSGNTDTTRAGLLNALSLAQDDWRRVSRAIAILRVPSTSER
jgi:hypothetical protein